MRHLLTVLVLAAMPVAAAAREPIRLKPSSNWYLDYAEDSCRLARKFAEGKQEVLLFLDQYEPGDHFYMILGGDVLRPKSDLMPLKIQLRFGPNEEATETTVDVGELGNKRAFIFRSERIAPLTDADKSLLEQRRKTGSPANLTPIGQARESAVKWMEIKGAMREDLVLETGALHKPLNALRTCSWDTVKLWGLDVDQQKTLSQRPVPKKGPEEWFTPSDYPSGLVRTGVQGIVNFRLIVDETGKLASCHIQTSTRPKEFDDTVCRLAMRRAKFEPALDATGKPVRSYWRQTVHFRLE